MTELFTLSTAAAAWEKLVGALKIAPRVETILAVESAGRILARPLSATGALPQFRRSTMDGYAARAADTHGASASLPAWLRLVGEVAMGEQSALKIGAGEAAIISTGGMTPEGADAVVMIEHTQRVAPDAIEVYHAAAAGENVIQPGEDIEKGRPLFAAGRRLSPRDIGCLMALGITRVDVARRPRVAILSQGDEVVAPELEPRPGQVRDVNSALLAALAQRANAEPLLKWGVLPDRAEALGQAAREALAEADAVVFSGGSSVSARDLTKQTIAALGEPGILAHGLAIKPGKPTIVAVCDNKPVFGLPGNPASAMLAFRLMVRPMLWLLQGAAPPEPRYKTATLARNIASQTGREDYVPASLERRDGALWAEPIFGKSNLIYTLARADGLIKVPLDSNGLAQGETVEVELF